MEVTKITLSCPCVRRQEDMHGSEGYLHLFVTLGRPYLPMQMCGQFHASASSAQEIRGFDALWIKDCMGTKS
jgi:hypothetical protein